MLQWKGSSVGAEHMHVCGAGAQRTKGKGRGMTVVMMGVRWLCGESVCVYWASGYTAVCAHAQCALGAGTHLVG